MDSTQEIHSTHGRFRSSCATHADHRVFGIAAFAESCVWVLRGRSALAAARRSHAQQLQDTTETAEWSVPRSFVVDVVRHGAQGNKARRNETLHSPIKGPGAPRPIGHGPRQHVVEGSSSEPDHDCATERQ